MQLSAEEVQQLRARLANRKSFFGGSLGTASASAAASYVPASQRELPQEQPPQSQAKKARQGDACQPSSHAPPSRGSTPQPQPRKATAADYAAFAALTQDTPPPQQAKQAAAAAKPAAAKPGAARPAAAGRAASVGRTPTPPPRAAQAGPRGTPPPRLTPSRGPTPSARPALQGKAGAKVTHGRSKKGQAMRSSAVAPQAVGGLTQSQKASQAWAAQAQLHRNSTAAAGAAAAAPAARGGASAATADAARRASGAAAGSSAPTRKLPSQQGSQRAPQQQQQQREQQSMLSSLQGKDLSRLPEWQRTILQRKLQAESRKRRLQEQEGDLDDFVVSDEEGDWRKELKSITGYDPSRFQNEGDDRSMEADWRTIQAEERRSARAGRSEDERAEAEEAARLRAKAKKRRAAG